MFRVAVNEYLYTCWIMRLGDFWNYAVGFTKLGNIFRRYATELDVLC